MNIFLNKNEILRIFNKKFWMTKLIIYSVLGIVENKFIWYFPESSLSLFSIIEFHPLQTIRSTNAYYRSLVFGFSSYNNGKFLRATFLKLNSHFKKINQLHAVFYTHQSDESQRRVFALTPQQRNENKYFIFSSGHRTHNQSRLQSHTCDFNLSIAIEINRTDG